MRKRKSAKDRLTTPRQLDKLIEEATVDCYDVDEQASGFFTMIEENFASPFTTRVLGVDVSVVAVEMDDDGAAKAVCRHGAEHQRIGMTESAASLATAIRRRMDCCLSAMDARPVGPARGGRRIEACGHFNGTLVVEAILPIMLATRAALRLGYSSFRFRFGCESRRQIVQRCRPDLLF
jgi:hypothetical protein